MIKFYSIQNGKKIAHEAEVGTNLMLAIGVMGDCGGCCICASCHVHIDPPLPDAYDNEKLTLDLEQDLRYNSRLSCQVIVDERLEGRTVKVVNNEILY